MSGNAYHEPPSTASPKKPDKSLWIFALLGGGFFLVALVCCGGGAAFFGFALNFAEEDLKHQLRDNADIRQHIGEIEEFSFNFMKTGAVDEEDVIVYDVRGSKGEAELTIDSEIDADGTELIRSVVMRLTNGETIHVNLEDEVPAETDVVD